MVSVGYLRNAGMDEFESIVLHQQLRTKMHTWWGIVKKVVIAHYIMLCYLDWVILEDCSEMVLQ